MDKDNTAFASKVIFIIMLEVFYLLLDNLPYLHSYTFMILSHNFDFENNAIPISTQSL